MTLAQLGLDVVSRTSERRGKAKEDLSAMEVCEAPSPPGSRRPRVGVGPWKTYYSQVANRSRGGVADVAFLEVAGDPGGGALGGA
jgi:hypothetical protein